MAEITEDEEFCLNLVAHHQCAIVTLFTSLFYFGVARTASSHHWLKTQKSSRAPYLKSGVLSPVLSPFSWSERIPASLDAAEARRQGNENLICHKPDSVWARFHFQNTRRKPLPKLSQSSGKWQLFISFNLLFLLPHHLGTKLSEMFALKNGRVRLMGTLLNAGSPWCAPIKVKHGHVSCQTPRGEHHKNVMGTRCKIRCKQGYESQSSEVVCMASKHWSSNYACRGSSTHTRTDYLILTKSSI